MNKKTPLSLQLKGHLRHEYIINFIQRQGRIGRDETRITPHHLYNTDSVYGAHRFGMRAANRFGRYRERGLQAECFFHVRDIIIYGLGNADHGYVQPAPLYFHEYRPGAEQGSVSPDGEQDIDLHIGKTVHNLGNRTRSARGA